MKVSGTFQPKLSDIQFHQEGWELHDDFASNRSWYTETRDPIRMQLFKKGPAWNFDLTNIDAARDYYTRQAQQHSGVVLQLDAEMIAGIEALTGIFKYKSPIENHLGMYFVGIAWLPFQNFMYQINFESLDRGNTGLREASVAAVSQKQNSAGETLEFVHATEALWAKLGRGPVTCLPSDDRRYDSDFPNHPLSKVRAYMDIFRNSVVVNKALLSQSAYRIVP